MTQKYSRDMIVIGTDQLFEEELLQHSPCSKGWMSNLPITSEVAGVVAANSFFLLIDVLAVALDRPKPEIKLLVREELLVRLQQRKQKALREAEENLKKGEDDGSL